MKQWTALMLIAAMLLTVPVAVSAENTYVGEITMREDVVSLDGVPILSAQLPNGFVYLPLALLAYYGFDITVDTRPARQDGGYVYTVVRNDKTPFFSTEMIHQDSWTVMQRQSRVYTTKVQVYLDSDTPANVYETEDGIVLIQSDELAKYGTYDWDKKTQTICIDMGIETPDHLSFGALIGMDEQDLASGVIVRSSDGMCAEIEQDDLLEWFRVYEDFDPYERVIAPQDSFAFEDYYIKIWSKDQTQKPWVVYSNASVIAGMFGKPYQTDGGVRKNYVWYLPYIGNARSALYTANRKLEQKYLTDDSKLRECKEGEAASLPTQNLLSCINASDWAKAEIQSAAACNLLVCDLTSSYTDAISRQDFCNLLYRLIMTEFAPNSDSRMDTQFVRENIVGERNLQDVMQTVAYVDCENETVKFLTAAGIVCGTGDNQFSPEELLSREQAATMLYRTAQFLQNKTLQTGSVSGFADAELISDWATESVAAICAMGVMNGVEDMRFAPQDKYTVEQAMVTMLRLYECR